MNDDKFRFVAWECVRRFDADLDEVFSISAADLEWLLIALSARPDPPELRP